MVYALIFFALLYAILLLLLIYGWKKTSKASNASNRSENLISVIIAFRNEAPNLITLLKDLENQTYANYEVLLVDDHSDDDSVQVVKNYIQSKDLFALFTSNGEGKKQAITTGVEKAKGTIIVTTDADCMIGEDWLRLINEAFQEPAVMLVSGAVAIQRDETLFSKIQAIEFASLIGSGAALIALQKPVISNGANLSFRKTAFETVNGYAGNFQIRSGDDEFLMRKIDSTFPNSIRFLRETRAVVRTKAQPTIASFFSQRFRWAGKWRHNSSVQAKTLAIFIFLIQLSFIVALILLFIGGGTFFITASGILLLRMMLEFIFLYPVCKFLKVKWHWGAFFILQTVYPFYAVFTGLFSNLTRTTWKGRSL